MTTETAWLIEYPKYQVETHFLHCVSGVFEWRPFSHWGGEHALRFSRRVDALRFIECMLILSNSLSHGKTIPCLREGDDMPRVTEHRWLDATAASPTHPEGVEPR